MPRRNKSFQLIFVMTVIDKAYGWYRYLWLSGLRARLRAGLVQARKCFTMANMSVKGLSAKASSDMPVLHHAPWLGGPEHASTARQGAAGLLQVAAPGYHEFDVQHAARASRWAMSVRATLQANPGR